MVTKRDKNKPGEYLLPAMGATYRDSLIHVTRLGGITAALFLSFFIVLYWLLGFPHVIVLIDLAALALDLVGLVLVNRLHLHKPAAHLITFAIYFSALGIALLTGGIDASSIIWMMFVPIAAIIMAGIGDGLVWVVVSVSSILGVYLLNRGMGIDLTLLPTTSLDRMIDLTSIPVVIGTAIWLNEQTKARAMHHLENAQALLNHLATIDPLTNVFNRRYFFDRAQIELEIAALRKCPTSILLLDIDHFKRVNDSYGHNIGDQILVGLVAICQQSLREMDTLARLGGEEFVILLPETGLAKARRIAECLRLTLACTPIQTDAGPLKVTVSIGVTSHKTSSEITLPADQLVQGADAAMYLAKRAGRNRVATLRDHEYKQRSTD